MPIHQSPLFFSIFTKFTALCIGYVGFRHLWDSCEALVESFPIANSIGRNTQFIFALPPLPMVWREDPLIRSEGEASAPSQKGPRQRHDIITIRILQIQDKEIQYLNILGWLTIFESCFMELACWHGPSS